MPSLIPKMENPKLCQSITSLASRSFETPCAIANVGMAGGFYIHHEWIIHVMYLFFVLPE